MANKQTWRRTRPMSDRERAVCQAVYDLRRNMNLSQAQFAEIVGATPEMVAYWERCLHRPSYPKLFRLRQLQTMMDHLDRRDRIYNGCLIPFRFSADGAPGRFNHPGPARSAW